MYDVLTQRIRFSISVYAPRVLTPLTASMHLSCCLSQDYYTAVVIKTAFFLPTIDTAPNKTVVAPALITYIYPPITQGCRLD